MVEKEEKLVAMVVVGECLSRGGREKEKKERPGTRE